MWSKRRDQYLSGKQKMKPLVTLYKKKRHPITRFKVKIIHQLPPIYQHTNGKEESLHYLPPELNGVRFSMTYLTDTEISRTA